jgi:hypothetical protein
VKSSALSAAFLLLLPVARPVPSPTPTPSPTPAPRPSATPSADAGRVAALVADAEAAVHQQHYAEAERLLDEALKLDPENQRLRAARAKAATCGLALTRSLIPDIASAEGAEGRVKEIEEFEVDGLDVRRAARVPGQTELEGQPSRVKPGDAFVVKIYMRNRSKKKKRPILIKELNVHRIVNEVETRLPLEPAVAQVAPNPKQRALLATVEGVWPDDVTSWILDVRVLSESGDIYDNRLIWK